MRFRRFSHIAAAVSVVVTALACQKTPRSGVQETSGDPLPEPVVPPGYQKIAPQAVDDATGMLSQTATIFSGSLKDIRFTFENCAGPRTNYVFSDASSLAGSPVQSEVTLKVLGGPTPSGKWVAVSELPQLALDSRYVVFLRNTDWTFSPVVSDLVFRVESVAGREILVHPTGRAVTGWDESGPVLSAGTVSDAVGRRVRGYKRADTPAPGDRPDSATTNPLPQMGRGNPPPPGRPPDSTLDSAPSLADVRKAGLFERPPLVESAIANEQTLGAEAFVSAVRSAAERSRVQIGGRLALDPNWRCWSSTPTARVAR